MKKALVMLLVLAMLVPMLLVMPASAEAATPDKPFYTLGWAGLNLMKRAIRIWTVCIR